MNPPLAEITTDKLLMELTRRSRGFFAVMWGDARSCEDMQEPAPPGMTRADFRTTCLVRQNEVAPMLSRVMLAAATVLGHQDQMKSIDEELAGDDLPWTEGQPPTGG